MGINRFWSNHKSFLVNTQPHGEKTECVDTVELLPGDFVLRAWGISQYRYTPGEGRKDGQEALRSLPSIPFLYSLRKEGKVAWSSLTNMLVQIFCQTHTQHLLGVSSCLG